MQKYILLAGLTLKLLLVNAQEYNLPVSKFLNKKIKSIEVDANYSNGNWKPVLKEVNNKKIVLLGELNHGSKEIFLSRNDLIKSLHQELGFNVILFEAGIGELFSIDLQKETLTPQEMIHGFFGGWRTEEFIELMNYVKSNNISISGFDVQRTGGSFEKLLISELERLNLNSNQFSEVEKRFSGENRKLNDRNAVYDSIQHSTNQLIQDYELLKSSIEKSNSQDLNKISYFIIRTIQNRIKYLEYYLDFVKDKDWNERWAARDYMMSSNIDWLLKTIYKNQKIIVIAHNFHISKYNEKEEVMGEFLKKEYNSEMYSIGVFAGGGSFSNNRGQEEILKPTSNDGLDIKHIINELNCKVGFLDIPQKENKNLDWLYKHIIINDTFIDLSGSNEMILSKNFDGLIFIDKISPPKKE